MCEADTLEVIAIVVAGACHDYKHFGLNNQYLIETKDPIAILYNGMLDSLSPPL